MDRYEARRDSFMTAILDQPTALAVAEAYLYGIAGFAADTGGQNPPGCLMLKGALSCCEQEITDHMARLRAEKEAALKKRFEQAKKAGDLPRTANAGSLARYLATMAMGISMQAASGASTKELREIAAVALTAWPVALREDSKSKTLA
jgi:hypothetical protein